MNSAVMVSVRRHNPHHLTGRSRATLESARVGLDAALLFSSSKGSRISENEMLDEHTDHVPTEPLGGLDVRFCEVMDAAPVMLWVSGADKNCVWFNRPWLSFTGRSMAQELGTGWTEVYIPTTTNGALRSTVANSMLGKN